MKKVLITGSSVASIAGILAAQTKTKAEQLLMEIDPSPSIVDPTPPMGAITNDYDKHTRSEAYRRKHGVTEYFTGGTYFRPAPKTGRNDPCPCGSGKKFKKCHELSSRKTIE